MEDKRAATFPNCHCNPRIAAVRVSGEAPDEVPATDEVVCCVVIGGGDEDAPNDDCGGGCGRTLLDSAAKVLAMESVKATDTKLLELEPLRRWYECWAGGRGDGPRRRRALDIVLAAGVLEHVDNAWMRNSNRRKQLINHEPERFNRSLVVLYKTQNPNLILLRYNQLLRNRSIQIDLKTETHARAQALPRTADVKLTPGSSSSLRTCTQQGTTSPQAISCSRLLWLSSQRQLKTRKETIPSWWIH
jgi:hypothetical protein